MATDTSKLAEPVIDESKVLSSQVNLCCCGIPYRPPSMAAPLVDKYMAGSSRFYYWKLPRRQDETLHPEIRSKLTPYTVSPDASSAAEEVPFTLGDHVVWSQGTIPDIAQAMFDVTKVMAQYIPEKIRGIYWMKNVNCPEILVNFMAGNWFEAEKKLVLPRQPFMWSFPCGAVQNPHPSFIGGHEYIYYRHDRTAVGSTAKQLSYSFHFSDSSLSYCEIQEHHFADMARITPTGGHDTGGWINVKFTMEERADSTSGSNYKRGNYIGPGSLPLFEFSHYELVKVMDGDGKPVQPWYDELVQLMGGATTYTWSGFTTDESEQIFKQFYENYSGPDFHV